MDKIDKNVKEHLHNLVDALETAYGKLEGFEVKLEHPIEDGQETGCGYVKSFVIYYIHKTEIEVDKY